MNLVPLPHGHGSLLPTLGTVPARDVAIAVKNARELALLPYTSTGR